MSEKPIIKAPEYFSAVADKAFVGRIERTDGDQILVGLEREGPFLVDGGYELCRIALATFTMTEKDARAVADTIYKVLDAKGK